jgi:hypothetical protein
VSASFADSSDARVTAEQPGPRVASVLAGLSAADRDLLLLIAWARPVDPPHDPAAKARAWARLHAEFDAPPRRRRLGARAGWRPVAIGVAAAVVFDSGDKRDGEPQTIVLDARNYRYMGDETQAVLASSVVDEAGARD